MKISELINQANIILDKHGDIEVYCNGYEEKSCLECGETREVVHDGFLHMVHAGNLNEKITLWLEYKHE